ncbi:hypothetical protein CPC08DRAFT_247977 [Agrocybe pediades]|nr:hypothetical protein CPC08DRAFT_247977 [Agrocybe pediades]
MRNRITLPYDVWYYVATFLPLPALEKLISVHRAFLHIFIKRQYNEVIFPTIYYPEKVRLHRNTSPKILNHVTTLVLDLHAFRFKGLSKHIRFIGSIAKATLRLLQRRNARAPVPSQFEQAYKLIETIQAIPELRSLIIKISCISLCKEDSLRLRAGAAFISATLLVHAKNIRRLSLSGAYYVPLLFESLKLPALEEFSVAFDCLLPREETLSRLISFLTRHKEGLKTISISIRGHDHGLLLRPLDPSYLFGRLPLFPRLINLSMLMDSDVIIDNIEYFVRKQPSTLQNVELQVFEAPMDPWMDPTLRNLLAQPIFQVGLPRISTLKLSPVIKYKKRDEIHLLMKGFGLYLRRLRSSLADLILDFRVPVCSLQHIFSPNERWEKLCIRSLTIHTCGLSPLVLFNIHKHLPCLTELDWTVSRCIACGEPGHEWGEVHELSPKLRYGMEIDRFVSGLEQLDLKSSSLRRLTIRHFGQWYRSKLSGRVQAVFEAAFLPNISVQFISLDDG